MEKFTSFITITLSSDPVFKEWEKITKGFFLKDASVVKFLKDSGMTKWTWTKTDEVEPVRVLALMEYKNKKSFDDCQKIFSKYMPNIRDLVYKSNIIRGNVIFEQI